MSVLALVCARGGSKGLPGKNLQPIDGLSLVARAVKCAASVQSVDRVIISSDSPEIVQEAVSAGAQAPFMRPENLATDTAAEWKVWQHALGFMTQQNEDEPDALLVVPPTAPLRAVEDLERCLAVFAEEPCDAVITVTSAHRNPWFNMVRTNADGTVRRVNEPDETIVRRQDAPACYDMTTVAYVLSPQFVRDAVSLFDGRVRCVEVPVERAVDIDTELDLRIARCLA